MKHALVVLLVVAVPALGQPWTHAAATSERNAIATVPGLPDLSVPAWTFDAEGRFESIGQSSPVISDDGIAIVLGRIGADAYAWAIDAPMGVVRWRSPIASPLFMSRSSPAVYGSADDGFVVVASGEGVVGFDLDDGVERWSVELGQPMVNASPAIVGEPARVVVSTYAPAGGGRAIVIDARSGDVLADETIGSLSGATPAFADGRVFLGDIDGFMRAYDLDLNERWFLLAPLNEGFFGGSSVVEGSVYAATYGFFGGRSNSTLARLDTDSGDVLWDVPSSRTDAIPIVFTDGTIVLSAGIDGFGSLSTVHAFDGSGSRLWDLVNDTWSDTNGNGRIDPGEYLSLGGWDHQPAGLLFDGREWLLVGAPEGGLVLLDLASTPGLPGFVHASTPRGGASPAVGAGVVISTWDEGVYAFGYGTRCLADFDGDGALTLFDFLAFQNAFDAGNPTADCDGDGALTLFDFLCFQNAFDAGCG